MINLHKLNKTSAIAIYKMPLFSNVFITLKDIEILIHKYLIKKL